MGYPKAWLPFGTEFLLQRVTRLLSEAVDPVVVVAAPDQNLPELSSQFLLARDRRGGQGPLEGLYAGLTALEGDCDAAFVTSCDVPFLAPAWIRKMVQLLEGYDIVVPRDDHYHHPLAAVYRVSVIKHIEYLFARDQLRPRFLFSKVNTREVSTDIMREVDPSLATLKNLNRPEEYFNALKLAGLDIDPDIEKLLASPDQEQS